MTVFRVISVQFILNNACDNSGTYSYVRANMSINVRYLCILATTNFVGKFTQSVRRIVQDVKDEGAPSGMTRDEVIETNERLRSLRLRLEESYDTVKKALINLMNKYGDSKSHRNIFQRYPMLKLMIKVRTSAAAYRLPLIQFIS